MRKFTLGSLVIKFSLLLMFFCFLGKETWGQTIPTAQALPYNSDFATAFGTATTTTYPAGWGSHRHSTAALATSFNTAAGSADVTPTASGVASTATNNTINYNKKLGVLAGATLNTTPILAVNTTGYSNIKVTYYIGTTRIATAAAAQVNAVDLQYRAASDNSTFTSSGGTVYTTTFASTKASASDTTMISRQTITTTLPAAASNLSVLQLRWATKANTATGGSRSAWALDNVSVTGTSQATSITKGTATTSTFPTVSCTIGSGAKRAIFIADATTGSASPVDGTTYSANLNFGSGDQIGSSGWFCVYNGTGTPSITIANLSSNHTYRLMVCEYDGAAGAEIYNNYSSGTGNPSNFTTAAGTPVISTSGTLSAVSTTYGNASSNTSFSISGASMSAGITITPPTGFEVCASSNFTSTTVGTHSSALVLGSSGTISSTTIYVRLSATAPVTGTYDNQNIVLTSTSATTVNVATASSGNTVSAKGVTITANNVNKSFGSTLTSGSGSTAFSTSPSLPNSETIGSVSITYGTGADAGDAQGTYTGSVTPSAATGGTFTASNYNFSYSAGNIIVAPPPSIGSTGSFSAVSTTYGTASAASTTSVDISGVDMQAGITVTPPVGFQVSTTSDFSSNVGSNASPITVGSAGTISSTTIYVRLAATATAVSSPYNGNVVLSSTNATSVNVAVGTGTVSPASLTITANNNSKTYGTSITLNVSTGFSTSTLYGSDAVSSVTLTSSGTIVTATVAGSPYSIVPSAAIGTGLGNYNITYSNGTLTVNTASLTITANDTIPYNQYNSYTLSGTKFTATGLLNSDAVSSVTLVSSGTAANSAIGSYTLTPSAATGTGLGNYNITYTPGTLTVTNIMADWTFQGSFTTTNTGQTPTAATGNFAADAGLNTTGSLLSAFHSSSSTVWSINAGNGSSKALNSNNWSVDDYYQIKFSTTGYENVKVSMDQTGSNTGPKYFVVQYSTDGTNFTKFGNAYSVKVNGSPNPSWATSGAGLPSSAYTSVYDLSTITALNDAPFVYLRLVDSSTTSINGGTVTSGASSGTDRLDNLLVTGNVIRVATQYYSNASGNLDDYTTWNTDPSGTGGTSLSSAADFTAGNAVFNISNGNAGNISGSSWTVSGIGSKVVVNSTDLTIGAKPISAVIDVNAGRTLTISNTTFPSFGTITAGTIKFKDISGFTVPTGATYGNVIFDNATISSSSPASSTPFIFKGDFTLQNSATFVNTNINLTTAGTANQTISGNSGSISIRNLESNNTTAKTGTLTLATNTAIAVGGSVIMNNTGSANLFNDGGNTITIGGNLTLGGNAAGYNLTGTVKMTAASGSTAIISSNGTAVCVASLNNLIVDLIGSGINCSVYPSGGGSIFNINGNLTFGNTNSGTGSFVANNNNIKLLGNYNNTRTTQVFSNTGQNIEFGSNTANQSISSSVTTGESFNNVTLSNVFSSGKITANNDITISGVLTQSAGNLEIVSGKTITFNSTTSQTTNGIIGAGNVTRTGSGMLITTGSDTYTGTTSFNAGTIKVTGSNESDVTVSASATLIGSGNVNGNVTLSGTLNPDSVGTVGTLHASNTGDTLTLKSNSTIKIDFTGSVIGSAGTNWDNITLNGDLNIAATNASPLSLVLNGTNATGFSSTGTYSWTIISGASSIIDYDANAFDISYSGFTTDPAYGFNITRTGNDIVLNYGQLPVITVSASSLTDFGKVVTGSTATAKTYTVSATNLTADVIITAPAGFQIKTPTTAYGSSLTLSATSGTTLAATTISVQYAPLTASGPSGTLSITNTTDGAAQKNVTVSGTAIDTKPNAPASIAKNVVTNTIQITVTPATTNPGAKRLIVVYPTSVIFTPTNGTTYTTQTATTIDYTSGQSQTGGVIVYNGAGTSVTVTGLNSRTTYAIAVYDYNDNNTTGAEDYSTVTSGSATTLNGTYTYIGSGTSSWSTSSNWSPTGIPSNGDDVIFNSGTVTVNFVPLSASISSMTVTNNASVTLESASSNTINLGVASAGSTLTVNAGSTLTLGTSTSLTLSNNATANIAGTLVNNNTLNVSTSGVVMNINSGGLLKNAGTVSSTATTLQFKQNSTYQHNQNSGQIPTATWNTNSTVTVTGCTSTAPGTLGQSFGNFDWSSTSQSSNISLGGGLATIRGDFTVNSTGSSELRLVAGTGSAFNMSVGGNVSVGPGNVVILGGSTAGTNTSIVTVTGKVTVNTSGTINMNGGNNAGNSTLNINGDLELKGGSLTRTFGATGSNGTINLSGNLILTSGTFSSTASNGNTALNFTKVGTQNATFNSSVLSSAANVPVTIASTSTVKLLTDYTTSSATPFTITNGGYLELNGHTLNVIGTLSGSGKFNGSASGSNLNMNSSTANTIYFGTGATDSLLNTFTLSGTGKVTLGSGVGISSLLSLNNAAAILDLNNNHLTLKSTSLANTAEVGAVAHGATIINGTVTVERFIPKEYRNYRDLGASVANAGSVFTNWQENGAAGSNVNNGFFITGTAAKGSPYLPGRIFETNSGLDYTNVGSPSMYTYNGTTWPAVTSTKAVSLNPFQGYRAIVRGARNFNMGSNPNTMPTATTVRTTGKLVTGDVTISTTGTIVTDNSAYNSSFALTTGSSAYSLIANPYACPVQWSKILGHSSIYNTYWYLDPTYQDPSTGLQRYITVQKSGSNIIVTPNPKGGSSADASFDYIQSGQGFLVNNYGNATPSITFTEADKTTGAANNDVFGQTATSLMSIELYKNNVLADATVANFSNNFTKSIGTEDASKMMNGGENISITESNSDLSIDGLPMPSVNDVLPVRLGQLTANTTYQLKADISNFTVADVQAYVRDNMLNTEVPAGSLISFTPKSVDVQSYKDRFSVVFKQSKVVPVVTVKGNISVFPNPVTAKSFKVQTANIASGKYNVVMVNSFGQEVFSTPITHVEGSKTETISMSKALSSGVYTLVLKSAEGKSVYQTEILAK